MLGSDRVIALDVGASKLVLAEFKAVKPQGLELVSYAVSPLGVDADSTPDPSAYIVKYENSFRCERI